MEKTSSFVLAFLSIHMFSPRIYLHSTLPSVLVFSLSQECSGELLMMPALVCGMQHASSTKGDLKEHLLLGTVLCAVLLTNTL